MVVNNVNYKSCIGQICRSNDSEDFKIVRYENSLHIEIVFVDSGFTSICQMSNIRCGRVKDLTKPSVVGVGVTGTKYKPVNLNGCGEYEIDYAYKIWRGILERCFLDKRQEQQPTYKGCTVSENFKSYEFFYEWCQDQVGYREDGFELDKDLLVKGNKIYSESTCCFIPKEINTALTKRGNDRGDHPIGVYWNKKCRSYIAKISEGGSRRYLGLFDSPTDAFQAYKMAKEQYLESLAVKWKDSISNKVYDALLSYEVSIDD